MTKILFFIHDLMHGGAEKVLVNLVNNMDYNQFDITVMTLFNEGVHIKNLNKNIKYKYCFDKTFKANSKILAMIPAKWLYKKFIKDDYDILVSYLEGSCTRIIAACPDDSVKKVAWVHIEQTENGFAYAYKSKNEAIGSYKKFDNIVCVSESVKQNFIELSGIDKNVEVLFNTNESEKIKKLSQEQIKNERFKNDNELKFCGVAKVLPNKGFMRLAKVHNKLIKEGYKHHVYILGIGEERQKIEAYLYQNGLEDSFIFLGFDENPYKYVARSDMFICSSFAEGFSTAATEALIVGTPVLTTLCAGMEEMLGKNNEYGIIVDNSEEGLYKGLKDVLQNPDKISYYKEKAEERGKIFSTDKTVNAVQDMLLNLLK